MNKDRCEEFDTPPLLPLGSRRRCKNQRGHNDMQESTERNIGDKGTRKNGMGIPEKAIHGRQIHVSGEKDGDRIPNKGILGARRMTGHDDPHGFENKPEHNYPAHQAEGRNIVPGQAGCSLRSLPYTANKCENYSQNNHEPGQVKQEGRPGMILIEHGPYRIPSGSPEGTQQTDKAPDEAEDEGEKDQAMDEPPARRTSIEAPLQEDIQEEGLQDGEKAT